MIATAAIFRASAEPISLEQVQIPELKNGELLVEVLSCALCRSDLSTMLGRRQEPTPTILGHEISGKIVAFGPAAPTADFLGFPLEIGSRVTWSICASCGSCDRCRSGLSQKCVDLFKYGHHQISDSDTLSGGLASHTILRQGSAVFFIPPEISDELGALSNCSTATAAAVVRAAGPVSMRTVTVFGAGVLGLTVAAMVHSGGASRVTMIDPNQTNAERSRLFGATHVNEGAESSDVSIELSGAASAAESAVAMVAVGGVVVLAGTVSPVGTIPFDPERFVRKCATLKGVHNYASEDLAAALSFLSGPGRTFPFESLITGRFRLDELNDAIQAAEVSAGTRVVIQNPK